VTKINLVGFTPFEVDNHAGDNTCME